MFKFVGYYDMCRFNRFKMVAINIVFIFVNNQEFTNTVYR